MSSVPLHPPPMPPLPVSFLGDRGEFRRLVARGAGLELITVGFYRFWLATDIRRHLWSNTLIDGDAAEYTGRARELLIGFLFALAILVPIYLAYFLVGLEVERFRAFASLPLFLFFYLFGQFAIFRARRYRLTRTVWRGVRFWMDGSGWVYAMRAGLWGLLALVTLGLALPWRQTALERYKMRHCYYGDLQGSFEGRGSEFFQRGWWLWLLALSPLIGLLVVVWLSKFYPLLLWRTDRAAVFLVPVMILLAPFLYGAFKAVEWRWWLSGLRFGGVRVESTLSRSALIGLYWKVVGWLVAIVALFSGYVVLSAVAIAGISNSPVGQVFNPANPKRSIPLMVMMAVGYLVLILSLNVVMRVYLLRDVWVKILASTHVHGIDAAANVSAKGDLASALGEGLADGLDVIGF
jgi:uncharacterized membrane protein YjgN (DUF898 family)